MKLYKSFVEVLRNTREVMLFRGTVTQLPSCVLALDYVAVSSSFACSSNVITGFLQPPKKHDGFLSGIKCLMKMKELITLSSQF